VARVRATSRRTGQRTPRRGEPKWAEWSDRQLLDLRMCDLGLQIQGTVIEQRVDRLYEQLERRGLRFRPHVWLSQEWFSPDGVPGIALPFYLAHPRLMKLEQRQMGDVEGGTRDWCMRILRHEAGHAIDNAYRLRRRRRWQQVFGLASQPYPESYRPKPFSKRHVLHLDLWYAQSHPCEDFAETFAVWLKPGSQWRRRYSGWPVLKKLQYVNTLMKEVADQTPPVRTRQHVEPLSQIRTTLREHYSERRARYGLDCPDPYDQDLLRMFSNARKHAHKPSAAGFLRRLRPEIRESVLRWIGHDEYTIDQVLTEIISRCRELKLRVHEPLHKVRTDAKILVAVHTTQYLHSRRHSFTI